MHDNKPVLAFGLAAIGLLAALLFLPPDHHVIKPAQAQPVGIPGPIVYTFASVTTAQTVLPQNLTRHAFQICNASAAQVLWVAPVATPPAGSGLTGVGTAAVVAAANGAGSVGIPVATGGGVVTCFAPPVNAPSVGAAWQAFAAGAAPVTVYEWP